MLSRIIALFLLLAMILSHGPVVQTAMAQDELTPGQQQMEGVRGDYPTKPEESDKEKSKEPEEAAPAESLDMFTKKGNLVFIGVTALTVGLAAIISSVNATEGSLAAQADTTPSITVTSPAENEEVFWMTTVSGVAVNFADGDYVNVSLQKYGGDWIDQEGYGQINPDSGAWNVRSNQFGVAGPADIGESFRIKAMLKDMDGNVKAEYRVERVIRK